MPCSSMQKKSNAYKDYLNGKITFIEYDNLPDRIYGKYITFKL